ncbi:hypothetical protein ACIBKY_55105 [Nonomuraea sp. NPDC050394]|uniref:hypothetical protein n=1 Tax=Nonomuraea sp. NPDC050394 TaxID=3364363 RepID=UPI003798EF82
MTTLHELIGHESPHPLAAALAAYRTEQKRRADYEHAIVAAHARTLCDLLDRLNLAPLRGISSTGLDTVTALIAELTPDQHESGLEFARRVWLQLTAGHLRILTGNSDTPLYLARLAADFGLEWRDLLTDADLLAHIGQAIAEDPHEDPIRPRPLTHYERASAFLNLTPDSRPGTGMSLDATEDCDALTTLTYAVLAVADQIATSQSA